MTPNVGNRCENPIGMMAAWVWDLPKKQSPRPEGNSADLNPAGNYSPVCTGAPSIVSTITKVAQRHAFSNYLQALQMFRIPVPKCDICF